MNRAPTSVKVLSILGIVFFAYGVFGLLVAGAMLFGSGFLPANPMLAKINNDPGYLIGTGILLAVGLPVMVLLLVASIGSLTLKPWARVGMLIYAVTTILNGVAGILFNFIYVIPLMLSALAPNDPARAGAVGGAVGGVCGGFLGMIYPLFIIYFYTRPHVIDAFHGIFPPSRDPEDDDYEADRRFQDRKDRGYRRYPEGDSDQITNRPGG